MNRPPVWVPPSPPQQYGPAGGGPSVELDAQQQQTKREVAARELESARYRAMPTSVYIGLTLAQAVRLAEEQGRVLRDRTRDQRRTFAYMPSRVNVWRADDGVVLRADQG